MPLLIIFFLLAGCGGGGGGGGGGGSGSGSSVLITGNPNWISSISVVEADTYRTAEYNAQYGLEQIKAAEAYATLAKNNKTVAGSGIKIGIVDTGVQTNHSEIAANYTSSGSHDYVNSDSNPSDDNGHGTHVASIAAGVKDVSGIHGVAYDSAIIVEKVLDSSGNGTYQNVADGVSGAVSAGAKVINLSLEGDSASTVLRNALLSAKSADVLTVAAAGNSGVAQPAYPAYYASDSSLSGYVLAVGAVDSSSVLASFSNHCGDAKDYCLVAPGVNIYAAYPTDSHATLSGTSMATPEVAGAAAVIRAAWTFLTAPQVAQILLQSATDLGTTGVDTTYGHGLLNLNAAVQAQGQNTLGYGVSVASGGYDLKESSMTTSAIFGDAFAMNVIPQLNSAIFFDDFGRDYKANLGNKIEAKTSDNISSNFNSFLYSNIATESVPLSFGNGLNNKIKFNFSHYKNPDAPNYQGLKFAVIDRSQDPQKNLNQGFSFTRTASDIAPNLKFGFAFNLDELSAMEAKKFGSFGFISQNNFAANPYQSFMQSSLSNLQSSRKFNQMFVDQNFLNQKASLRFSYQNSYDSSQIVNAGSNRQNQILDFTTSFAANDDRKFLLSLGNLTEFSNNILNSKSLGAFGSSANTKTSYLKFSVNQKLIENLHLIGSFSEGISKINGNQQGIFREFDNVRSRSSSVAIVYDNFWKGKIGAIYSEPLRVYSGSVKLDIPIARDAAGNLTRYQGSASLVPQGKERDVEFFYSRNLGKFSEARFNFVRQAQAGNIKNIPVNYFAFASYKKSF